MTRTSAGVVVVILCSLLVGFLLGVALDVKYRPNETTLYLQSNTKMSVQPRPGDIVRWVSYEGTGHLPQINFTLGKSPCRNSMPSDACWYDPSGGYPLIALYDCMLDGSSGACSDPGVGPKSGTGGGGGIIVKQPPFLVRFFEILWIDLERFIGRWPELTPDVLNALAASKAGGQDGTIAPALAANAAKPRQPNPAVVDCVNGKPGVFVPGTNNPFDPIPASVGDTVSWYPNIAFSISPLSICDVTVGSDGTVSCTIKNGTTAGSHQYQVNISSCAVQSGYFNIKVQ